MLTMGLLLVVALASLVIVEVFGTGGIASCDGITNNSGGTISSGGAGSSTTWGESVSLESDSATESDSPLFSGGAAPSEVIDPEHLFALRLRIMDLTSSRFLPTARLLMLSLLVVSSVGPPKGAPSSARTSSPSSRFWDSPRRLLPMPRTFLLPPLSTLGAEETSSLPLPTACACCSLEQDTSTPPISKAASGGRLHRDAGRSRCSLASVAADSSVRSPTLRLRRCCLRLLPGVVDFPPPG